MSKLNVLGLGLMLVVMPAMAQQKDPRAVAKVEPAKSYQGETQLKLLALLRISPTLGRVVSDDPHNTE